MSQEKVDRYKQQKANRKKLIQKEKRQNMIWKAGCSVAALVLVGWIGFSAYDRLYEPPRKFYDVDTSAIDTYMSDLSAAEVVDDAVDAVDDALDDEDGGEEAAEAVSEEETAEQVTEGVSEEETAEQVTEGASEEETTEQTTETAEEESAEEVSEADTEE